MANQQLLMKLILKILIQTNVQKWTERVVKKLNKLAGITAANFSIKT